VPLANSEKLWAEETEEMHFLVAELSDFAKTQIFSSYPNGIKIKKVLKCQQAHCLLHSSCNS